MHEELRFENRAVRQVFGSGARVIETGPDAGIPGGVAIVVDGASFGSGGTFRAAMADALTGSPPAPADPPGKQVA